MSLGEESLSLHPFPSFIISFLLLFLVYPLIQSFSFLSFFSAFFLMTCLLLSLQSYWLELIRNRVQPFSGISFEELPFKRTQLFAGSFVTSFINYFVMDIARQSLTPINLEAWSLTWEKCGVFSGKDMENWSNATARYSLTKLISWPEIKGFQETCKCQMQNLIRLESLMSMSSFNWPVRCLITWTRFWIFKKSSLDP